MKKKKNNYWKWALLGKRSDKTLYDTLFPNYYISIDNLTDVYKTSTIVKNTLINTLILCNEKWYMLDDKTKLWHKQKEPSFYVITEIRKYIDFSNKILVNKIALTEGKEKDEFIELSKSYLNSYNRINQPSYFTVVIKYLRPQLTDNLFSSKLDNNPGNLAFKNGMYDLENYVFREGILSTDFITDTIPFDYTTPYEEKKFFTK